MSEELDDLSVLDEMDIPEVVRDESLTPKLPRQGRTSVPWLVIGGLGFLVVTIGAIAGWQFLVLRATTTVATENTKSTTGNTTETTTTDANNPGNNTDPATDATGEPVDQILGHFAFEEAPASELVSVSADGRLKLRAITAEKYQQMVDAARRDGVNLVLISGFRSIEEQQYLFFQVKEQRGQDTTKRAEVSAPPRHSEHHTGYAIDVGDGNSPGTNLSQSFEKTAAFRWLQNNAARFSFELSFPRDNPQGIAYEPWHWRFVGDQDSLETFYQSRNLTDVEPSPGTSNTP